MSALGQIYNDLRQDRYICVHQFVTAITSVQLCNVDQLLVLQTYFYQRATQLRIVLDVDYCVYGKTCALTMLLSPNLPNALFTSSVNTTQA